MGNPLYCSENDMSEETYSILSQIKKLPPNELKCLFEKMINCLTKPTKEGLVFLVWEGLEPHERDLFNFPSNDFYSESIKENYLEIFHRNQPMSSIWINNRDTNRYRVRNSRNYNMNESRESRRRRSLNLMMDNLFGTELGFELIPMQRPDSAAPSSSSILRQNISDNQGLIDITYSLINPNSNSRGGSPTTPTPTTIANNASISVVRSRRSNRRRRINPTSQPQTSTRFISTENRTLTINNNDITTLNVIPRRSRNQYRSYENVIVNENDNNNNDNSNDNDNENENSIQNQEMNISLDSSNQSSLNSNILNNSSNEINISINNSSDSSSINSNNSNNNSLSNTSNSIEINNNNNTRRININNNIGIISTRSNNLSVNNRSSNNSIIVNINNISNENETNNSSSVS